MNKLKELKNSGQLQKITVIVIAIFILLILLFAYLIFFDDKPNEASKEKYSVAMPDIGTMKIYYKGTYTGERALRFRGIIDTYKGNNDGIVTQNEVNNYWDVHQSRNESKKSTWGFEIDNKEGVSNNHYISITGVVGDVDSERTILIKGGIFITWPSIDTEKNSYNITIWAFTETSNHFQFRGPSDYKIHNVSGLADINYNDVKTTVTGTKTDTEYPFEVNLSLVKID